jgi:hypothetical protein
VKRPGCLLHAWIPEKSLGKGWSGDLIFEDFEITFRKIFLKNCFLRILPIRTWKKKVDKCFPQNTPLHPPWKPNGRLEFLKILPSVCIINSPECPKSV